MFTRSRSPFHDDKEQESFPCLQGAGVLSMFTRSRNPFHVYKEQESFLCLQGAGILSMFTRSRNPKSIARIFHVTRIRNPNHGINIQVLCFMDCRSPFHKAMRNLLLRGPGILIILHTRSSIFSILQSV